MNRQYGLFLFSVQHRFLVSVSYCSHVLNEETKHITKDGNNNNNKNKNNNSRNINNNNNPTERKNYAVENMHSIFKKALCVKIVDATLTLLEA